MTADPTPARVLVVEDEPALRSTLARLLTAIGHESLTASSGESALELLKRERVECVLTDLRLTGMNGEELAERIATEHPGLKGAVVLMSGFLRESQPGLAFLQKPFTVDQLRRVIADVTRPS